MPQPSTNQTAMIPSQGAIGLTELRVNRMAQMAALADIPEVNRVAISQPVKTRAFVESVPVFYIPETFSKEQKLACCAVLVLMGKSTDDNSTKWQTWLLTLACSVFPELQTAMASDTRLHGYSFQAITETKANAWTDQLGAMYKEGADGEVEAVDVRMTGIPELPDISDLTMSTELLDACTPEAIVAYYSLALFYACKTINPENREYVTAKRPKALIDKRGLHDVAAILNGDHRFPSRNIPRVKVAFARSTHPREKIFQHHASLCASPDCPEALETLVVTMELMRNMNMTYIGHIANLIAVCPWVSFIDELWNQIRAYKKMVEHLKSLPDLTRDYYKLMYLDRALYVFRKDIEALIACATVHAYQTRRNMNQYRISEDSMNVVEKFINLAKEYGYVMVMPQSQQKTEQAI